MILGLGIDLLEIDRMERAMRNPRFADRVFTQEERARIGGGGASERAAGMFAAKEAVVKALGTGFGAGVRLHDAAILGGEGGAPYCRLGGRALDRLHEMGGSGVMISITHGRTVAVAVAVIV